MISLSSVAEPDQPPDPAEQDPDVQVEPESPYWAATLDQEELAAAIMDRVKSYYEDMVETGLIDLYSSAHAHFFSLGPRGHESSQIIQFGVDGEKLGVKANHLRSIGRYIMNATTADKVALKPKARNATAKARAQIPTASRVLDYYLYTLGLEDVLVQVVLRALLYGKGYLWQFWDPNAAPGGDLVYRACSPLNTAVDLDREAGDHDWFIFRVPRNKYDLIALKPELEDEIKGMDAADIGQDLERRVAFGFRRRGSAADRDTVYEYHFLHRRTPAMPEGRLTIVVGGSAVRFDGPLPYKHVPVVPMVADEFAELGDVGYSNLWDLIGLQDYYDAVTSVAMTNMDAAGNIDILLPDGVELGVEEIRGGLNVIRYPAGEFNKPSVLDKFQLKDQYFKLRDSIRQDMEMLPGVNQVARGQPEASLKSGAALALVDAQAIKFQTGFIRSYKRMVAKSATNTIEILSSFCPPERVKEIAGANDPDGLVAFSDGSLDQISEIECEVLNPIFAAAGGRQEAANNLLQRDMLKDASQYMSMIETGRPEAGTGAPVKADTYYQHVQEVLMSGPVVIEAPDPMDPTKTRPIVKDLPVTILDNPEKGLKAAQEVLWSIELRKNPAVVAAATAFAQETLRVWRLAPVDLLAALGYPPAPSTLPPPAEPGEDKGGKPAPGKPPPENKPQKAPAKGSGMPSLPQPAKNPNEDVTP